MHSRALVGSALGNRHEGEERRARFGVMVAEQAWLESDTSSERSLGAGEGKGTRMLDLYRWKGFHNKPAAQGLAVHAWKCLG
jgi:hypothetical protein